MSDLVVLKRQALRLARLCALDAPAIVLAGIGDRLLIRLERVCIEQGLDLTAIRADRAASAAEPLAPLTPAEAAEMEAEEAAYDAAEAKARASAGYSDEHWARLDPGYRFELVMAHFEQSREVRTDG